MRSTGRPHLGCAVIAVPASIFLGPVEALMVVILVGQVRPLHTASPQDRDAE